MSQDAARRRISKRRHIRLDLLAYARPGDTWFITVTALERDRMPLLDAHVAEAVRTTLINAHTLSNRDLLAYCVMPDRLHSVTHVRDGGDVIKLVNGFKSFSTRAWWGVGGAGPLWQRSFHDRWLGTEADIEATLSYVWENPVRWGLADDDDHYSFRGGVLFGES